MPFYCRYGIHSSSQVTHALSQTSFLPKLDLIFLTQTWLDENSNVTLIEAYPLNYNVYQSVRQVRWGRWIAIAIISFQIIWIVQRLTQESFCLLITILSSPLILWIHITYYHQIWYNYLEWWFKCPILCKTIFILALLHVIQSSW